MIKDKYSSTIVNNSPTLKHRNRLKTKSDFILPNFVCSQFFEMTKKALIFTISFAL